MKVKFTYGKWKDKEYQVDLKPEGPTIFKGYVIANNGNACDGIEVITEDV